MEDKQIPYFVHEGIMARMERTIHRLWITTLVLILALIASNIAWFFYDQQFETYTETTQEVTQDTSDGGTNNFIGGDYYGEADSQDNH